MTSFPSAFRKTSGHRGGSTEHVRRCMDVRLMFPAGGKNRGINFDGVHMSARNEEQPPRRCRCLRDDSNVICRDGMW